MMAVEFHPCGNWHKHAAHEYPFEDTHRHCRGFAQSSGGDPAVVTRDDESLWAGGLSSYPFDDEEGRRR